MYQKKSKYLKLSSGDSVSEGKGKYSESDRKLLNI